MADNDQFNDEYQFSDLDALNPGNYEETTSGEEVAKEKTSRKINTPTNVKRNVLIAVSLIILAMIIYKFLGSYFSKEKVTPSVKKPTQQVQTKQQTNSPPKTAIQQPVKPIEMPKSEAYESPKMEQKIAALEVSQQSMRSEVKQVSNQLGGVNSNMNELATSLSNLQHALTELNSKIDAQSQEIEQLIIRTRPKPKPQKRVIKKTTPVKQYFVQAVIPGRAWLISSNGTTLTVREGSTIPGYGVVKLIDPLQGRVSTSSGKVIRFSQNDS